MTSLILTNISDDTRQSRVIAILQNRNHASFRLTHEPEGGYSQAFTKAYSFIACKDCLLQHIFAIQALL
jgi:hypothetical protein